MQRNGLHTNKSHFFVFRGRCGNDESGGKTRRKGQKPGQVQYAMDVDAEGTQEQTEGEKGETTAMETETEEEDEPDFPEVKLDELLEDFDEMTLGEAGDAEQT